MGNRTMIRLLTAVCLLFALSLPGRAGNIIVTMNSAAAGCPSVSSCTVTFNDTDANIAIILQAHAAQCQAANNGVACTPAQQSHFAALAMIEILTSFVTNYQKQQATTVGAFTPVNPTAPGSIP
jgi:DNA-binding MurR/RpiR family transcriptional regulator